MSPIPLEACIPNRYSICLSPIALYKLCSGREACKGRQSSIACLRDALGGLSALHGPYCRPECFLAVKAVLADKF